MARHDERRTGMAAGKSDVVTPATYWKKALGGNLGSLQLLAGDVDGDGKIELVHIRAGRLVVAGLVLSRRRRRRRR